MHKWKKILLLFTTLILLAGIVLTVYVQSRNSSWQKYMAQLQADGEPLTFADIQARREPQPATNTIAEVVTRVAGKVKQFPYRKPRGIIEIHYPSKVDFFAGLDRKSIEITRQYVTPRLSALAELENIDNLKPGHFTIDYDNPKIPGTDSYPDHSPHLFQVYPLVFQHALLQIIDGNQNGAVEMIHQLFDLMSPLTDEPSLLAHGFHMSAASAGVDILENILRVGVIDSEKLHQLDTLLAEFINTYSIKWGLWAERIRIINMSASMLSNDTTSWVLYSLALHFGQKRSTEMISWLIDADNDPAKMLVVSKIADKEIKQNPKTHFITKLTMSNYSGYVATHLNCLANMYAARIAIAAEQFRLIEGRLPASLNELVPAYMLEIPTDPYDQLPMKFATNESGIIIYSIGDDVIDNGGYVAPDEKYNRPQDRGFRLLEENKRGLIILETTETN